MHRYICVCCYCL